MNQKLPEDAAAFHELMLGIDAELAEDGIRIHQRPIRAASQVAKRFNILLVIAGPKRLPKNSLASRVDDWYEEHYGKRLKIKPDLGSMAVPIAGDLWVMSFPMLFGTLGITEEFICQNIAELPSARWKTLPIDERNYLGHVFFSGFQAISLMRGTEHHPLVKSAIGNLRETVTHLTSLRPDYGLAKWASSQLAEKVLKAAVVLNGAEQPWGHELNKISDKAGFAGLEGDWDDLLPVIQCGSNPRYGSEPPTRDDALAAHHASLVLILRLHDAGARFKHLLKFEEA